MRNHLSSYERTPVHVAIAIALCVAAGGTAPAARAAQVIEMHYTTEYGVVTVPYFKEGLCRFRVVVPDGWRYDLRPRGDASVVFRPPGTTDTQIAVSVAPVSLAEHRIDAWRRDELLAALRRTRNFSLEGERRWPVDHTESWQCWGRSGDWYERHSFHIRYGYLIDLYVRVPPAEARQADGTYAGYLRSLRSFAPGETLQ